MKYNYPVKYAAMPIIEQVGWSQGLNELERNYDVICYIVSKCYLLSDKTKYKENGKKEKEYEVVFPYQKRQYYNWKRVVPSFNFNYNCTNSDFVKEVFDNYEKALEFVTQKNKELCKKTWGYLPYIEDLDSQISKKIEEFNDKLSRYKMLEQQILINTSDLKQSSVKELNKLIMNTKDEIKVLSSSLYEYLKCSYKCIVYSISQEQYDKLVTLINNQDISNVLNVIEDASPILYHDYEASKEKIMVINKNGDVLYFIDEYGTLESNNEQKIPSIELSAIGNETRHLFTTETLEDIVLSFKSHKCINPNEIQGPILKKKFIE